MTDYFDESFKLTMSGLEKGLQVAHITTSPVLGCESDEDIAAVLTRPELVDFDMIPVRYDEKIVGILRKGEAYSDAGTVRECMHLLDESVLISADVPLVEFINSDVLDRLVLRGTKIDGIVTRSDFLKLPVRLLAFSMVTHVETLMTAVIRRVDIDEQTWLAYLGNGRRKEILRKQRKLSQQRANPDLLEHTYFADKRTILEQNKGITTQIIDEKAIDQLKQINELRNTVAHTGGDVKSQDPIRSFIERLQVTQNWIQHVQDMLAQYDERAVV